MKADTLDFTRLFGADIQYVVPTFQRPYVWDREKQWEPLWDDVAERVDALLHAYRRADSTQDAERVVAPHFLGALVLDPLATGAGSVDQRHVIDGQQRLTTLQLLIGAIADTAAEHELERQQRLFRKLVRNDEDLVASTAPEQRFKVWPTKWDRSAFQSAMMGDPHQDGRLGEAYRFFFDALQTWAKDAQARGEQELVESFDALAVVTRGLLKVVVINLEPNDNAQAIFEVLNARGTELRAVDLVKNLVFREAEQRGEDVDRLYDRFWQFFDSPPWQKEVTIGRLRKARGDQFLTYWLVMRMGEDVHAQQIFPTFRELVAEHDGRIESIISDVARHAEVFDGFDSWPTGSVENRFFRRMRELDLATFNPLLLLLFGLDEQILTPTDRRRALSAIESWLVRRAILGASTKDYNKIVPQTIRKVRSNIANPADGVVTQLATAEGPTRRWPTDEEVRNELVTVPLYKRLTKGRLRMLLAAIENHLRSHMAERLEETGALHIEHVLPQDWGRYWALPGTEDEQLETARREEAKHRLGNLTLVTSKLNQTESNSAWPRKRALLREHSVLKLNQDLVDYEEWNEGTIEKRGQQLANAVLQIWPSPERFLEGVASDLRGEEEG